MMIRRLGGGEEVRSDEYEFDLSLSTGIPDLETRPRTEQDDWACRCRLWLTKFTVRGICMSAFHI